MTPVKAEAKPSAMKLAEMIGRDWGNNTMDGFVSVFSPEAEIVHPFFRDPIPPRIAADVLNATVCGTTEYRGAVLIQGDGSGQDDVIDMYFDETGQTANYRPNYFGRMHVRAWIRDHQFTKLFVFGYELVQSNSTQPAPFQRLEMGDLNVAEITRCIGEAWGSNDMTTFISLFSEDGIIMHPLFRNPITPQVAADVLNSAMRGITVPLQPKSIVGNGRGEFDVVEMFFNETGSEAGGLPDIMGVMHCTAKIINHRIKELYVHGYTPAPSCFTRSKHLLKPQSVEAIRSQTERETVLFSGMQDKSRSA